MSEVFMSNGKRMMTIPVGGRPTKYTDAIGEQLRLQKLTGMEINELAEYWEVSPSTMFRWLKKAGCTKTYDIKHKQTTKSE